MTDPLKPTKLTDEQQAHLEQRNGQRMHNRAEFDNLKADIRQSNGRALQMPWSIGRPTKSAGMNPRTGEPITPLAALDINQVAKSSEAAALNREMDRAVVHDQISEGVLDQAEAQDIPLEVTPQWWEEAQQDLADQAETAAKLQEEKESTNVPHKL